MYNRFMQRLSQMGGVHPHVREILHATVTQNSKSFITREPYHRSSVSLGHTSKLRLHILWLARLSV